jgi:hypothetical protein
MRAYWTKIFLGALAIFVVGYAAIAFARSRVVRPVRGMVHSTDPIAIPLAFIPFVVDGNRFGTFQRLTIDRETPRSLRAFRLRVRVPNTEDPTALAECRMTPVTAGRFEVADGFRCLGPEDSDSGLVPFGEIRLSTQSGTVVVVPLLLDEAIVTTLREEGREFARAQRDILRAEEAAARAQADRARAEARILADSIQQAVRERLQRPGGPPDPGG